MREAQRFEVSLSSGLIFILALFIEEDISHSQIDEIQTISNLFENLTCFRWLGKERNWYFYAAYLTSKWADKSFKLSREEHQITPFFLEKKKIK